MSTIRHAARDKAESPAPVWRIVQAEHADGDKTFSPARVCHVLQVEETGERALAQLGSAQRGLAHRDQISAAGFGRGATQHRLRTGAFTRVFPAVMAIGHQAPIPLVMETAAVLQVGADCVVSHASAAALWQVAEPLDGWVETTVIGRHPRHVEGIHVYRVAALDIRDTRVHRGLPVTSPARTLIDYAGAAGEAAASRAVNEARALGLVTDEALLAAMQRAPGRRGVRRLRSVLTTDPGSVGHTRSGLEVRVRRLISAAQLPTPRFNVRVHGFLVDAHWERERVVLEADGYAVHGRPVSFERDRRRDQVLAAHGYIAIRVTWRQLEREPMAVAARLAAALALRGA